MSKILITAVEFTQILSHDGIFKVSLKSLNSFLFILSRFNRRLTCCHARKLSSTMHENFQNSPSAEGIKILELILRVADKIEGTTQGFKASCFKF